MKYVNKRFHCHDCSQDFEQTVLETAVTVTCPNCRPLVYLLELIGLTPKQALVLMLCVVGVGYLSSKS
jgi:DNA-directed RNA polymerase subunit RPC12/RpoP